MSSIKKRIAELEVAKTKAEHKPMTDVERAVRMVHILNGPDSPIRARLQEFLDRLMYSASGEGLSPVPSQNKLKEDWP